MILLQSHQVQLNGNNLIGGRILIKQSLNLLYCLSANLIKCNFITNF